jgi:hypothetical protein
MLILRQGLRKVPWNLIETGSSELRIQHEIVEKTRTELPLLRIPPATIKKAATSDCTQVDGNLLRF